MSFRPTEEHIKMYPVLKFYDQLIAEVKEGHPWMTPSTLHRTVVKICKHCGNNSDTKTRIKAVRFMLWQRIVLPQIIDPRDDMFAKPYDLTV